jgi:hypothetical protein
VGAGVKTFGGGTEGQALDIKEFSPRVSHGDLIVFTVALLLVVAGGMLKQFHDNRTVSVEVGGITVIYPRGWYRYSVQAPELLRVVSNEDGATTVLLVAEPAGQTGLVEAVGSGIGNRAAVKTAYVQLANEQIDLRAMGAYGTDYAYVDTAVSGASPPEVIRGRKIAWIMNNQIHVLALESPERSWEESQGLFQPIVDQLQIEYDMAGSTSGEKEPAVRSVGSGASS